MRCRWLARLTGGRLGMGRWTQAEVDRFDEWAEMEARRFREFYEENGDLWL